MNLLAAIMILASGSNSDLPRNLFQDEASAAQEDPVPKGLPQEGPVEGEQEPPSIFDITEWGFSVDATFTHFDKKLDIDNAAGIAADFKTRFDTIYYYRIGIRYTGTEFDDISPGEDVDVWTGLVGFGMDFTFDAWPFIALDIGVAAGVQIFDSSTDDETGYFLQAEVVLKGRPMRWLAIRAGITFDWVHLDWLGQSDDEFFSISGTLGVEVFF